MSHDDEKHPSVGTGTGRPRPGVSVLEVPARPPRNLSVLAERLSAAMDKAWGRHEDPKDSYYRFRCDVARHNPKPTASRVRVPMTPIILGFHVHSSQCHSRGRFRENVAQAILVMLAVTATTACQRFTSLNANPNRKRPMIPPPAMPANCQPVSRAVLTCIMAIPVNVPSPPQVTVKILSMVRHLRSSAVLFTYFL